MFQCTCIETRKSLYLIRKNTKLILLIRFGLNVSLSNNVLLEIFFSIYEEINKKEEMISIVQNLFNK